MGRMGLGIGICLSSAALWTRVLSSFPGLLSGDDLPSCFGSLGAEPGFCGLLSIGMFGLDGPGDQSRGEETRGVAMIR